MATRKIGRNAGSGRFTTVKTAEGNPRHTSSRPLSEEEAQRFLGVGWRQVESVRHFFFTYA